MPLKLSTSVRFVLAAVAALAATAVLYVSLTTDDRSAYLIFVTWGTPAEVNSFQRLVEHYNVTRRPLHPVRLSHEDHTSYIERLLVQAAARNLPDVIHLDQKDLPMLVHRQLLEDLTPVMEGDSSFRLDRFLPQLLPGAQSGGRWYAVPHNFSTMVLYYNKDHFDAEGLAYPDSTWTWTKFRSAAQRLTKTGTDGRTTRYGCLPHIVLFTMIYQNGGNVLNARLDSCVIASPEAAEAVQFDIDLSEKYGVTWNILAQDIQWDDMFAGGRCAMIANGRWAADWYLRAMPQGAMDVAPLPRGRLRVGGSVNHMMALSAQSRKKQEAWEFLKFLVSEQAQRMLNEHGANIPAVRSIAYGEEFLRHHKTPSMNNGVFLDELSSSRAWPFDQGPYITHYVLQSQMDLAMRRILLGEATTTQSLSIMQDNVNAVIARQKDVPVPRAFVGSLLFVLCCLGALVLVGTIWFIQRRSHGISNLADHRHIYR